MNKFTAKCEYDKKIAKKFHNVDYYKSNEFLVKNIEQMEKEKIKLKTNNKDKVTKKLKEILQNSKEREDEGKVFHILEKIYKKNQDKAFGKNNEEIINNDLINLISDVSLLRVAYKKVRKNSGAMTEAYEMSNEKYKKLQAEKKSLVNKLNNAPDGIDEKVFQITSKLIKENEYPWGTSRRIQVDKPGKKNVKRPITIPPFMDKVIQEAITMILKSIYEPYFEAQNCSFGFRPNKGVHDAIVTILSSNAKGLNLALEGDIKSAYDKVDKTRLIEILSEKIVDRKFLNFIKKRLNYEYYDTVEKKYIIPEEGLPQGGIDSPYLWNIYMKVFDEYIINYLDEKLNSSNEKVRGKNGKKIIKSTWKRKIERFSATTRKIKDWIKENRNENIMKELEVFKNTTAKKLIEKKIFTGDISYFHDILKEALNDTQDIKTVVKNLNKIEKKWEKASIKVPSTNPNKIRWRYLYVRYADDWIILTNIKKCLLEKIKENIKEFLYTKLKATLSIEKTLLTDLRENSAHFLGFEIKAYKNVFKKGSYMTTRKNGKKCEVTAKIASGNIFIIPDRQRIIERLHMKGYCDEKGFPKEIGFISFLDDFSIIERYNSVLLGMALYYVEFIRNPEKNLARWFYIIRFSCIKTIAQKHKMSVREVFKKYIAPKHSNNESQENTIKVDVKNIIGNETYKKTWTLYTMETLIEKARSLKRKEKLFDIYWRLYKEKEPVIYEDQEKYNITSDNFYNKITWVNTRTRASFDLPCAICGSEEDIQMHHIKHIRKDRYDLIDENKTWERIMSIRNRKQINLCRECHINIVHRGKYGGAKIASLCPKIMYDNRIISIESQISEKKLNSIENQVDAKTLIDKGWRCVSTK